MHEYFIPFYGWTIYILGFPNSSVDKESACSVGDSCLIPGSGRTMGEGIGYPFQYFGASLVTQLEKNLHAMWKTWVGKISWRRERLPTPVFWCLSTKSWAQLSKFDFRFIYIPLCEGPYYIYIFISWWEFWMFCL